ncbi:hypothetical protein KC332_g3981 [Hortaea werneckii]|uniref:Heterokaryon incompatibility domain-containing protein n=1 Tax=Hortaea werneckii TaxID=91943 RepID=A0A3M7IK59_HORWE|nr:hypothetical protein KC350_g3298 [Hortaea werneckii]KAI6990875.1 hypothetical protein KC329_g4453 [Hortaea werneckii]KAI7043343.1 hypothetical protein KC366_g4457 [Hortaea werneckii]KAI7076049.1 hypothetical protein KC327_g3919 [Hortaea werneckii]KAI7133707.1 hypothetical protein KC337_g4401 [Hortaea werneckii]
MNLTRWKSPSYHYQDISNFHYPPLKSSKTSIRLAVIQPGTGSKALSIKLIDSFVTGPKDNLAPYDALSYTWGTGPRSKHILCNGKRMQVTETLLAALHRFRRPRHEVTLWIDQICICQERVKERNQQVQMMGDIFKGARKVIVWLGEDYEDSRAGMQLARQLCAVAKKPHVYSLDVGDLETHGLPKQGHKRWKALAAILQRPWFWRTWVVQEVVLNPNVELVLGAAAMFWDELESVVALLEGPAPSIWQPDQVISASELPFARINRIRIRHRRLLDARRDSASTSPADPPSLQPEQSQSDEDIDHPDILELLLMSRGLGATDPRDKIYALLGLSKHDIEPDYSQSPESIFIDFALQTLGVATNKFAKLEAIDGEPPLASDRDFRRAILLLSCAGRQNQSLSLPSWVPDWTTTLASRPLIFGLNDSRYSAGGNRLGVFDWKYETGLHLSGILLDTVQVAGSVRLDFDPQQSAANNNATDYHALIAHWWQEAHQLSRERIDTSPGSTPYTDAFERMRRRLYLCRHGYYIGGSSQHMQHRRGSLLDDSEGNPSTPNTTHSAMQTFTLGPTRGRVMFVTSTGFLGLAPHGAREGDLVFVVRGIDVPLVLRTNGDDDGSYELIGESYVQGVMEGEALLMRELVALEVVVR